MDPRSGTLRWCVLTPLLSVRHCATSSHIYLKDTILKIYPINLVDSAIYVPGMLKTFSASNTSTEEPGPPAALLPEN